MRLNAQELLVRKRCVLHTRSALPAAAANAIRDGAYSGTARSACGSSAAAGSDIAIATNRADRTLVSAVEAATEILAVRRLNRIGKDFEHRNRVGRSKGLAARNLSSRSLGSQDYRIDRFPREPRVKNCRSLSVCQMMPAPPGSFYTRGVRRY
jgi:hypothetical protein